MKLSIVFATVLITTVNAMGQFFVNPTNGYVGIGTITPAELLHLNGSIRGNQSGALRISSGNGYIDIGPKNTGHAHFYTDRSNFYFNTGLFVDEGWISSYNEDLSLKTAGTTRVTLLNSNGYVGIGTSPTETLDVNGTARFRGLIQNANLSRVLVTDTNGKLYWKDAAPVTGDNLGNHTATSSILASVNNSYDIGSATKAFKNIHLSGSIYSNSHKVLSVNTNNTLLGVVAGNSLTTGTNNYFVGYGAGSHTTTGSDNVYIGEAAGQLNDTGNNNVLVGGEAGPNGNGGSNTFIGFQAGLVNDGGSANTFLGQAAGYYNVNGWSNTAIGSGAGPSSSSLFFTSAIGNNAQVDVDYGIVLGTSLNKVGIRQNSPAYPLHVQNAYCNGSTWVNASDENLKENFAAIGKEESILSKVREMPIEYWNYKGEEKPSRHIGPTAQDFYNLFKVGDNDKSISTVDAAGVAFAAIQELAHRTEKLEQIIAEQHDLISNLLNNNPSASTLLSYSLVQLHQNTPNPFTRDTEIRMTISDDVSSATLFIYDLRGNQVKKIQLTQRGNVSATIEGRNLSAGIYFYTLIADHEVAGTKRMILTD